MEGHIRLGLDANANPPLRPELVRVWAEEFG